MADRGRGGRGEFRGRGDFRGRARGDGGGPRGGGGRGRGFDGASDRGGRGGGSRGGRGGGPPPQVYGGGAFPQPNPDVTRSEDASVKDLSTALAATSLGETLPRRPGYGKTGTPIVLWTNYFHLKGINADIVLYRYSVAFQPENDLPKPKKKRLIQLLLQRAPFTGTPVASDWAQTLIAPKKIDLGSTRPVYDVEWYPEDGEPLPPVSPDDTQQRKQARQRNSYRVLVEELDDVSARKLLNDLRQSNTNYPLKLETIQALNIVLTSGPSSNSNIATAGGNKFYPFSPHPQFEREALGGGLEALRGYFTSVRTGVNRILVNVNVATAAFYRTCNLMDLMHEVAPLKYEPSTDRKLAELDTFVRKLRIETNYIRETDSNGKPKMQNKRPVTKRKVHTITNLSQSGQNSTNVQFSWTNPNGVQQNITVQRFFDQVHGIKLSYPTAPLVNYGNRTSPKWIPAELCTVIAGQLARRLLQSDQTRNMIAFAARRPFENAHSIVKDGLQVTKINTGVNEHLTNFGINVDPKMLTVPGRILQPPTLQYRGTTMCSPRNGAWNLDVRQLGQRPFRLAKTLGAWTCLVINKDKKAAVPGGRPAIKSVLDLFGKTLDTYGMSPGPIPEPVILDIPIEDIRDKDVGKITGAISDALRNASPKVKPKFLFVLLAGDDAVVYDSIKLVCDCTLGIGNVCSLAHKFTKPGGQMQYFANLALKFNQKLGGINHSIDIKELKPLDATTIVFGIDVTHPSPGSSDSSPSIAGVVASIDTHFAQYPASMRTQRGRQEMVADLKDMIKERLKLWSMYNNGQLPKKVIVYRDGVSEGQYPIVMREEYPHFIEAFKDLYGAEPKHPKISIIVVGKRHHTRFYPTNMKDTDERTGNPKPGTVVDRGVTGEKLFDFFLLAHQGLQGTSKPAHYVVLKDENKLRADQLQILTHNLCYTFARATRAVSVCPPAYYADLLCERGRSYLHSVLKGGSETFGSQHWKAGVHADLARTMYYL